MRPVVATPVLAVLIYGTVSSLGFLAMSATFRFPHLGTDGVPALAEWVPWMLLGLHCALGAWLFAAQRGELHRRDPSRLFGALAGTGLAFGVLIGLQLLAFALSDLRVLG